MIDAAAVVCPHCGVGQPGVAPFGASDKRILIAFLLGVFLPLTGAHRFYAGKIGTGLLQLVTGGGLGIWWLIDMIMLVSGRFRDRDGEPITEWT